METQRHATLKALALAHLVRLGFTAAATEVRAPASRYRVDVAAYIDRRPAPPLEPAACSDEAPLFEPLTTYRPRPAIPPQTVIVECKQHRGDFLRDRKDLDALLEQRLAAERRRLRIEDTLKDQRPDLRRAGGSLFDDLASWDFGAVSHGGYRATLAAIRRLDRAIHADTKFFLAAQHRLADRLYILAPRNMIQPAELPRGWGLLEASPSIFKGRPASPAALTRRLESETLITTRRRAEDRHPPEHRRAALLRNIAARATLQLVS